MEEEYKVEGGTELERVEMIKGHTKRKVSQNISSGCTWCAFWAFCSVIAYMVLR